ncbi:MAG: hypothetical protein V4584_01950 [Verrucomicrobiota bacterium]
MIQRFQIEDIVVQDTSGVVFRAMDTETEQLVALRRFFPFGAKGGGLDAEEQIAYGIAVERLSTVAHPSLRSVICGGCDPIDGMPFIATEWIEGTRLKYFIEDGPLTDEEATSLLTQALEVCQLLSEVLAEEAVWVETDLQAIVIGTEESGRNVTFWISPLKWLGKHDGQRGLESIITLTEEVMGWSGKTVGDQAAGGLGSWLKWLRAAARTTSLHEAREMLAASIGIEPPLPAKQLVRQATRPMLAGKKRRNFSSISTILIAFLALVAAGLGGALLVMRNAELAKISGPLEPFPRASIPLPQAAEILPPTGSPSDLAARILKRNGVFTPSDHDLLAAQPKTDVIVEGTLASFGHSGGGALLYLQFSNDPPRTEARGAIKTKGMPADLTESSLAPLLGRKVRLHGKVQMNKVSDFPVILIENRDSIQVQR